MTATIFLALAAAAASDKPNVLVILSDDVGWAEFGFQGGKDIPTPNIDSIAKNGVRFTQGYVSGPYCSPTRAGLMTGRYQTRFGHEFNSSATKKLGLSLNEKTFPSLMKEAGYATCAIGKWHLGGGEDYRPTKRGFDEFFGTLANTPYYHPTQFVDSVSAPEPKRLEDPNFYTTDAYGDRAAEWIGKQKSPWFLYLPFNAQHNPLEAPKETIEKFAHIQDEKRRTFAAMMSKMDDAVGKVLGKIREKKEEENTIVFFLSDNGGPTGQTTSSNVPLRGFKATTWEGGVRVPFCMQWKGKLSPGVYERPVIQLDILPTCLAAAGIAIPNNLDGVDLMPFLTGTTKIAEPHTTLYWRFGNQWAVRHGDWKLLVGNGGSMTPELYNLKDDLSEKNNLAETNADKVAELKALWEKWNGEQAPPIAPREQPAKKKGKGKGKKKPADPPPA
jgi:arylsulfatase A-like enzyme